MTKPSTKKSVTSFYEINPPHVKGSIYYDKTKVALPENHLDLFQQSKPYVKIDDKWTPIEGVVTTNDKVVRFAVDANGNVHRFDGAANNFHWNGQTNGVDGYGKSRSLSPNQYPSNLVTKKK